MPSLRIGVYSGTAPTVGTNAPPPVLIGGEAGSPTAGALAQWIEIRNLDGTNALQVSFDGQNWFTINALSYPLRTRCAIRQFYVRGAAGTPAWCALTNEG